MEAVLASETAPTKGSMTASWTAAKSAHAWGAASGGLWASKMVKPSGRRKD